MLRSHRLHILAFVGAIALGLMLACSPVVAHATSSLEVETEDVKPTTPDGDVIDMEIWVRQNEGEAARDGEATGGTKSGEDGGVDRRSGEREPFSSSEKNGFLSRNLAPLARTMDPMNVGLICLLILLLGELLAILSMMVRRGSDRDATVV